MSDSTATLDPLNRIHDLARLRAEVLRREAAQAWWAGLRAWLATRPRRRRRPMRTPRHHSIEA